MAYHLLSFEFPVVEIGNAVPELACGRTTSFNTQFPIRDLADVNGCL